MVCFSASARRSPNEAPEPQTGRETAQSRQLLARPHERKPLHLDKRRGAIRSRAAPWESAVAARHVAVDFQIGRIATAKIAPARALRAPCAAYVGCRSFLFKQDGAYLLDVPFRETEVDDVFAYAFIERRTVVLIESLQEFREGLKAFRA